MNEIKKLNPVPLFATLEANPESDAWIKQREKELAEQAEKDAAYQSQKNVERSGVPRLRCRVSAPDIFGAGPLDQ